ncbi:alpha/beta hydrolase, partial [Burkholderia multivorans]
LADARTLAQQLGSAFVNLGDAGHINTAAGFGPWPRAKYFVDTLVHCAAPLRFRDAADDAGDVSAVLSETDFSLERSVVRLEQSLSA